MERNYYEKLNTSNLSEAEQRFVEAVDSDFGYNIAIQLTKFKATDAGFRLAGTDVENEAADWIVEEMNKIGLHNVTKASVPVDSWDFREASVRIDVQGNESIDMEAGSFPCIEGTSDEDITGEVVYVGEGNIDNYKDKDVAGKIVMIDTDGYHSYWYNSIFLQAELKGVKAIIATVTDQGPGTYNDEIITIQDVMTHIDVPAVMLNKGSGDKLRSLLKEGKDITATINVDVTITKNAEAHYVYGMIPGKNPDRYIILAGHYDAYWDGFLDNASSLGTTLTIAKAMIDSGYEPESTFIFISNGAEECGKADAKYDFCVGAEKIIKDHPEWIENTILYNNFELTAASQTAWWELAGTACYKNAFEEVVRDAGFEGVFKYIVIGGVGADDGVYTKAGVPSYTNIPTHFSDISETPYASHEAMENYDHTQYDNSDRYNPGVFDFNNKIHGLINIAFDKNAIVPFDFSVDCERYLDRVTPDAVKEIYPPYAEVVELVNKVKAKSAIVYKEILSFNKSEDVAINEQINEINKKLLKINRLFYKSICKLDPFCMIIHGYKQPYRYVKSIDLLISELKNGKIESGIEAVLNLDNNYLIPDFEKAVYKNVAIDAFEDNAPDSWGKGENMPFPDMYDSISKILYKVENGIYEFAEEISMLEIIRNEQMLILEETINSDISTFEKIYNILESISIN